MHKIFVESRIINAGDFDLCWRSPDLTAAAADVVEPFIHALAEKGILPVEKSLKLLSDKSRLAFLPLDKYDVDMELARGFPGGHLPPLVRAALRPDEQGHFGGDGQSVQPAGGQGIGRGHHPPAALVSGVAG